MRGARVLALGAALGAALVPALAAAHGRSTSTSAWEIAAGEPAQARITVRAAWADLQRALPALGGLTPFGLAWRPDLARRIDAYLTARFALLVDGAPCTVHGRVAIVPSADPTHIGRRWRVRCQGAGPVALRAEGFFEVIASHLHLARLRLGEGPAVERVFVLDQTEALLGGETVEATPQPSSFGEFALIGIEHIASGYDHLAFLLALLLVGVSVGEVATIVTGFTVAHSLTLALGVVGWVQPQSAAVEALIGLSIAVVALENASLVAGAALHRAILASLALLFAAGTLGAAAGRVAIPVAAIGGVGIFSLCYFGLLRYAGRPLRLRWFLAFVFGLIHGFGFAGVLAEMDLPRERMAHALFGFNLGVEAGQLVIVAAAWPLLRFLLSDRWIPRTLVVQAGSAGVLAAGLFWFVSRALA